MAIFFWSSILFAATTLLAYYYPLSVFASRFKPLIPYLLVAGLLLLLVFILTPEGLPYVGSKQSHIAQALAGIIVGYLFGHWLYFFHTRFVPNQRRSPIRGDDIVTISLIGFIVLAIHPGAPFSSLLDRIKSVPTPWGPFQLSKPFEAAGTSPLTFSPGISWPSREDDDKASGQWHDAFFLARGVWIESLAKVYLNPNMVTHQIGSSVGDKATNLEREDPSLKFIVGYFLPYFLCTLSSFEGASGLEVELEMLKFRERLHDLLYSAPVGQQIDANIELFHR